MTAYPVTYLEMPGETRTEKVPKRSQLNLLC